MSHDELVKALRECAMADADCQNNCPYYNHDVCTDDLKSDAAAAIEALQRELNLAEIAADDNGRQVEKLQAEVKRLNMRCADCEYGNSEWPEDPEHTKMPKRGEWIKHPEVKNIYGGEYIECPFCGEKYVVQYIADEKFCRNCGADMRAKMEVQDESSR